MNGKSKVYIKTLVLLFSMFFFKQAVYEGIIVDVAVVSKDTGRLVLIDPGHGGMDSGAVSKNGTLEKNINLSISLKVRDNLKDLGYRVSMTRETDMGLYSKYRDINIMKTEDLNKRCELKRETNCDLFISIHQNFFPQSRYHGAQIWHSKNDASRRFAHILQENLKMDLGNNKREEKEAKGEYKILRCYSSIPSVIIECGFLTNPEEEKKLLSEDYQNKIAESIVESIEVYFKGQ